MLAFTQDLFVVVHQLDGERAPQPRPLASGFSPEIAYRVLGVHTPSETAEAYFILSNDRDEVWFVSNRHFRTHALLPGTTHLRMPVAAHVGDGATLEDGLTTDAPLLDTPAWRGEAAL